MNLGIQGKVALVTGSSRGIGKAIALRLAREGCQVALNARNVASLQAIQTEFPAPPLLAAGDVSDPADAAAVVAAVVAKFGRLDIVIANVGSGRSVPPGSETHPEWQRVFAQNLWSTTNTVEASRDALRQSKGSVICISSICGLRVVAGAPTTYSVAKAALHAYVAGAARPLAADGVRIAAVALGNIQFPGSVWEARALQDPAAVNSMLRAEVPLARFGQLDEVANFVAYMASPECSFATGSVWAFAGGQ